MSLITDIEILKGKKAIVKVFTIKIISELIKKHLIQEKRDFFDDKWIISTISAAIGLATFSLFTHKISDANKDKRTPAGQVIYTDFIKFSTLNIVKAILLTYVFQTTKISEYPLTKSILLSLSGSLLYELLFPPLEIPKEEKEIIKNTKYYENVNYFSNIIKETVKTSITVVAGDLYGDGDIDTDGLISLFITMIALPIFFMAVEPKVANMRII